MVYRPPFLPGDPRGFCQNLLRGLTCESVLNLCFLPGITVKPCVSPHVLSVAYPSFPGVHSLSRTGGSPRIQHISLYIYVLLIPVYWLELGKQRSWWNCRNYRHIAGGFLLQRDCIPLRNHPPWESVK